MHTQLLIPIQQVWLSVHAMIKSCTVYTRFWAFGIVFSVILLGGFSCGEPINQGQYIPDSIINGTFLNERVEGARIYEETYSFTTDETYNPSGTYTRELKEYRPDPMDAKQWNYYKTDTTTGTFQWWNETEGTIQRTVGKDTIPIDSIFLMEESFTTNDPELPSHDLESYIVSFYVDDEKLAFRSFNRIDGGEPTPLLTGTWQSRYERQQQTQIGDASIWQEIDMILIEYQFFSDGNVTSYKEEIYGGSNPIYSDYSGIFQVPNSAGFIMDDDPQFAYREEEALLLEFSVFYRQKADPGTATGCCWNSSSNGPCVNESNEVIHCQTDADCAIPACDHLDGGVKFCFFGDAITPDPCALP
jgi:hypothetical protein